MQIWVQQSDIISELEDLGIDTTPWSASGYAKLNIEILRAQREFELKTRRKFERATITEKANGNNRPEIVLAQIPIVSVNSLTILEGLEYPFPIPVGSYKVDNETGIIHLYSALPYIANYFPSGEMNIEANYTHGYLVTPTNEIPDDIKDAIAKMVIMNVLSRTPADWEKTGLRGIRIANYQESYGGGGLYGNWKKEQKSVVDVVISRYKRLLIL